MELIKCETCGRVVAAERRVVSNSMGFPVVRKIVLTHVEDEFRPSDLCPGTGQEIPASLARAVTA